jgi:cytoskeleton protein RodZ
MTAIYSLTTPENPTIEISQDELRAILGDIEAELHRSKVYRRALATIQKIFGESSEQGKQLIKAVGREAIGVAFHKFTQQQHKKAEEKRETVEENTNQISVTEEKSGDLAECLTSVKFHSKAEAEEAGTANLELVTNTANTNTAKSTPTAQENNSKIGSPLAWLKNKKPSKAELAQEAAAQQRVETLREIGKQLREARELQGLSLAQLNIYTHVPPHQIKAIENGNWDELPEEVYVRGFIRVMGNSLGLNGTKIVAALPAPEPVKTIAPVWYKNEKSSGGMAFDIRPMHLYVGYTALVAGAVGGLSLMSQQTEANRMLTNTDKATSSSFNQTVKENEPNAKPGLQSNSKSISVGSDIAPPEAL